MANFTMADLKKMREARNARINANKAESTGESREYLLAENLATGSEIWFPKKGKPEECLMRIMDFMVTKKDNIAGDEVGKFTAFRTFKVHTLPNRQVVICPSEYGRKCPLCEYVHDHYDEIVADRKHPAAKLKAKKVTMFNALFKVAGSDGSTKFVPRVVRGSNFFIMTAINKALTTAEKFNPTKTAEIYNYDDLEEGYWIEAQFADAPAVAGSKDEYMQLVNATLLWKEARKPIPEKVFDYITDLDALIPDAPSGEFLARAFGLDTEIEKENIGFTADAISDTIIELDEEDTIDCGVVGSAVAPETAVIEDEEIVEEAPKPVKAKATKKPKEEVVEEVVVEEPKVEETVEEESFGDDDFDFGDFD